MTFSGNLGLLFLVFWPITGAFACFYIGRKDKKSRDGFAIFIVALNFAVMIGLAFFASNQFPPYFLWEAFMGFRIYFRLDGFRAVYGVITAFMWLMTTLFSKEYFAHYRNRNRYYFFSLLTFGATLGVFLSADLITTFIFFEVMSLTSYVLVIHDERPDTLEAARTYMAIAIIGGLALLLGLFIVSNQLQTTEIAALHTAMVNFEGDRGLIYLAAAFMMVGFGGKAGMYPLHIWLPNAHPVAPAPASALLSGVLTKTGVYGIIIVSTLMFNQEFTWGFIMVNFGIVGMFTGAMLALFSTDLKRTLAYSSVSQIGFIILGVGMQGIIDPYYNSMPIQGSLLHMVNHSLIKLLLFMAAGVVVLNTHELDLNKIRGFGRGKPLFTFCFLMGVLTIIGMPFWSGYISKTLLHESLVYHIWGHYDYSLSSAYFQTIEGIFTLTGGLTTAYMIKLFVCLCVEKNAFNQEKLSALNKKYITKLSAGVLAVCAVILPVLGFAPSLFMIPIGTFGQEFMLRVYPPYEIDFLAWINLRGALTSMVIGVILYTLVIRICLMSKDSEGRRIYLNAWPAVLDIEKRIYRPLLLKTMPAIGGFFAKVISGILPFTAAFGFKIFTAVKNFWIIEGAKDHHIDIAGVSRNAINRLIETEKLVGEKTIILNRRVSMSMGEKADLANKQFTDGFMSVIFSSLAYSLLIFFIGFTIVQIIIFIG